MVATEFQRNGLFTKKEKRYELIEDLIGCMGRGIRLSLSANGIRKCFPTNYNYFCATANSFPRIAMLLSIQEVFTLEIFAVYIMHCFYHI